MEELEQRDVEQRILALIDMPVEVHRALMCGLVGHSRIKLSVAGRPVCARCEFSSENAAGDVFVGDYTSENLDRASRLDWRDTMLAPDPIPATAG